MEIRKVLALRGPNYWANFPVLEAWVDLGSLKDTSSEMMPGFTDRLMGWLPSLIEHRCSVGERGGFLQRLERGTYLAHILEHVTLELQTLAGTTVGFGRARETSEEGVYRVAIEYEEEALGRACLEAGHRLCLAAVHNQPFDIAAELEKLRDLKYNVCLGPSTGSIVDAARARGIPVRRLNGESLVQLGYGAKQRRILTASTDRTGSIAEAIAKDKQLTRALLLAVGVPTPDGRPVSDAEDAWKAAQEIGAAVVVKPQYGNQGRGVTTNLLTRGQVVGAYESAKIQSDYIVVERFAPGDDYRLLVVGDRLVAAARRESAHVVGDGRLTIRQLVDEVNRDPRRSTDHATSLTKIRLEEIALAVLADQGFTPESIPPAGARVLIRRNANLSTGGTATDVTDLVHPEVSARAIEAAKIVGLDIAGVDVVARDISQSLESQGGVIVEVNAGPGLRMHLQPSAGQPRNVGEAIINHMFPEGQNGRIPVIAVTGVNGKTTTTRFIAHVMRSLNRRVGMTCTDGIYIDKRRVDNGDCSGPASAQSILMNPTVDVAVLETARGGILRAGLGFDKCDVAVVMNIGEGDHLGVSDICTLEKLAFVKRTIVDVVLPTGAAVLKADDPLVAAMAPHCKGSVIFFALSGEDPVIQAHRKTGGRAVYVRHGMIVVAEGEVEIPLAALVHVPLTHGGRIGFQIENTLATVAATWSLGVPRDAIRSALETFVPDMEMSPARFNVFQLEGATVVVDYGHNPSAIKALIEAFEQFPHQRRLAVFTCAGDRRDCDMIRQGELLGDAFDRVILYEDQYIRGRKEGEISGLIRQGLAKGSRIASIEEIRGANSAVEKAFHEARPGDLLFIQADEVDTSVEFVQRYLARHAAGQEIKTLAPAQSTSAPILATQVLD